MSVAQRFQLQTFESDDGGVAILSGRDSLNGLPVRVYQFFSAPTYEDDTLSSDHLPAILFVGPEDDVNYVISAFPAGLQRVRGMVPPNQVETFLKQTARALDEAAAAGMVHGDLRPERIYVQQEYHETRYYLEGYGVPWELRPTEYAAPERVQGASFAADIFSWARTVQRLTGPLPGEIQDLLQRCLSAKPADRPHAREIVQFLNTYAFPPGNLQPRMIQAAPDRSAFETYDPLELTNTQLPLVDPLPPAKIAAQRLRATLRQQRTREPYRKLRPESVAAEEISATDFSADLTLPGLEPQAAQPSSKAPPQSAATTIWVTAQSPQGVRGTARHSASHEVGSATGLTVAEGQAATTPLTPTADSVRQIDGTRIYQERLEAFREQQREAAGFSSVTRQDPAASAPLSAPAAASDAANTGPRATPRTTAHATQETPVKEVEAFRQRLNALNDFDVIDDIDDRLPPPSEHPSARRSILLTLLFIAILILIALQFVYA